MSSALGRITCFWAFTVDTSICKRYSKKSSVACYPEKLILYTPWPFPVTYIIFRKIDHSCLFFRFFLLKQNKESSSPVHLLLLGMWSKNTLRKQGFYLIKHFHSIISYYISQESWTFHNHISVIFTRFNCILA